MRRLSPWLETLSNAELIALAGVVLTAFLVVIGFLGWAVPRRSGERGADRHDGMIQQFKAGELREEDFVAAASSPKEHVSIPEETGITSSLRQRKDLLILGRPGIGKSHEAIKGIRKFLRWRRLYQRWRVIVPDKKMVHVARDVAVRRLRYIVLLDDVNEYIDEVEGGERVFDIINAMRWQAKELVVVATVRSTAPESQSIAREGRVVDRFVQVMLADWPVERGGELCDKVKASMEW